MYPNIKDERIRLGWGRPKVAEYLGVARQTYANWERGRNDVPASRVIELARLFQCSTDYLLGVSDKRE